MNIILHIIDSLTLVIAWEFLPMFPHDDTIKTRLTYLYIVHLYNSRITPNGSLLKWWGYAQKWAHPP